MATTKPTFQNQTTHVISVPRYNFSGVEVPPNKYVTGAYYNQFDTLDGQSTGVQIYEKLGLIDVSAGNDPLAADVMYDYVVTSVVYTLDVYANNAAAKAGGLKAGMMYRLGGDPDMVAIVH